MDVANRLASFKDKDVACLPLPTPARAIFPTSGLPLVALDGYRRRIAIPLGQAIGRFANYVNQELYGAPTNLPWGIQIPRDARVAPYESLIDYST